MIGRMPASLARATASWLHPVADPIIPINPRKTSSCSTRSSISPCSSASRQRPEATPKRSQCSGQVFVNCQISALRVRLRALISSPTNSCTQRASKISGAPFVKTRRRSGSARVSMDRAHQFALGRERYFGHASRRLRVFGMQPGFARRDDERPSVGSPCTVQRPSRSCNTALLARSAAVRAHRNSNRVRHQSERPAPAHFTFRRVARTTHTYAPTGCNDDPHRHLILGQRAGLVGGNDVGRTKRLDCCEMADDGVALAIRCTPRKDRRHYRWQAFGHRCDRKRHAQDETSKSAAKPRTPSTRRPWRSSRRR